MLDNKLMNNRLLKDTIVLLLGSIIFMLFALYNGFPIVSGDSITYLQSGFELKASAERPIFYGLFIRLTSLNYFSVWLTMFIQSLILCYVVLRLIKHLLPRIEITHQIGLVLIIALGTISSWYAGQLMPDIFTPILGISVFLFLFSKNTKRQVIILLCIIFLSTLVHFSNYISLTLLAFVLIVSLIAFRSYRRQLLLKTIGLLCVAIVSWTSLMTSNYLSGRGFVTSSVAHIFLMGKLSESGVLKTYLEKACPIYNYKICAYKDNLPPVAWEFVWDQTNSPVFKTGGWDSNKVEYNKIIKDIASRPKYWGFMSYKSIEATIRQVILTNIDEGEERSWIKFEKDHPLFIELGKRFPHEINEFQVARQNYKTLNLNFYDDVYILFLLLTSVFVLFGLSADSKKNALPVYIFFIGFIFINAFSTATFGNVLSRLNSRNIWLLPMINLVYIYCMYAKRYIANNEKSTQF